MTENTSMKIKSGADYTLPISAYENLERRAVEARCMERTPLAFFIVGTLALIGMATSLYAVALTDSFWWQLLNGSIFGFFSVQLGLIGHDLSHEGVFATKNWNKNIGLLVWALGCGLSESRWFYKHNAHHQAPNHIGHDPDIEIPFVFDHEQAANMSRFEKRRVLPYQHIWFWVGIWFVYPYNILHSMRFLFTNVTLRSITEMILMALHFGLIFGFTFYHLPLMTALGFNVMTFLVMGVYMALIFAPNHKGEDMVAEDAEFNWVQQITLTRNITPGPISDYILGGLGYQVEHHLFPNMSRFQYGKVQPIVRNFCQEYSIPYHEVSWPESMKEIHRALAKEAANWR